MKRLMILAAMTLAAACGDDSSSDDGTTQPTRDAGRDSGRDAGRDASRDARSDDSPKDASSGGGGGDCDTLTYDTFGKKFMTDYCSQCHAATKKDLARMGAPADKIFDTLAQIKADVDELRRDVVEDQSMPFVSALKFPSDDEREQFGKWLDCGPN